jgi:hypothetical protein
MRPHGPWVECMAYSTRTQTSTATGQHCGIVEELRIGDMHRSENIGQKRSAFECEIITTWRNDARCMS